MLGVTKVLFVQHSEVSERKAALFGLQFWCWEHSALAWTNGGVAAACVMASLIV